MASEVSKSNVPQVGVVVEDSPRTGAQATRKDDRGKVATREELDRQVQKYRAENKALHLRILGVNELARLLQDRTEVTEVLQEKNKRLEVAVVRLENRCSNFERKLRAQSGGTVGPKPGQSPFIPGPSRQILEALMKENSELKKTLNNVTKKGAAGYLEAVKTTQLEEVIDTQKQEVEFLKTQIQSLTNSSIPSDEDRSTSEVSLGLGSSFNSTIESAPLKQQLIKLRNALRVKDRFNSLLCQKVAEFEERVKRLQKDSSEERSGKSVSNESDSISNSSAPPVQDTGTHDADPYSGQIQPQESSDYHDLQKLKKQLQEQKSKYEQMMNDQVVTLQKEREERLQLVSKLGETEKELKSTKSEFESLTSRCEGLSTYNQTLVDEKSHLTKLLSDAEQRIQGSESSTRLQQVEKELRDLQQLCDEQVTAHSEALQEKEKEIGNLRLMLEDAQYKFVISESKLSTIENEKKQEIEDLKEKVEDLEMDVSALQNAKQEDLQKISELSQQLSYYKASTGGRMGPHAYQSHSYNQPLHCGPILKVANQTGPIEGIKDLASKNATGPQTAPVVDQTPSRRAHSQQLHQLSGHCGENIIDTTIRQEVPVFISRSPGEPENPPITTSAQKPLSLKLQPNLRMSQTHPHPMTTLSPSQYATGNILGMQNTPTTPVAPNQPVRSHSPGYPRYTMSGGTPYPNTSTGSYYYSRQPSVTMSGTVPYQYTPTNQKAMFGSGYTPSMPSIQSSGYGSMGTQSSGMPSFIPQSQTASPQRPTMSPQQMYMSQLSKDGGYNSFGSFSSGTSFPPQPSHPHPQDAWAYSQQGYHHTERRSSSPHEYGYQHP